MMTIYNLILVSITLKASFCAIPFEWQGAAETGRHYALGDPPPRPPRLPSNSTCSFGNVFFKCIAAHNYFHDFDPIENAQGNLIQWYNDACSNDNYDDMIKSIQSLIENENDNQFQNIIMFVHRGGCSFSDKVLSILSSVTSINNQDFIKKLSVVAIVLIDTPSSTTLLPPGLGEAKGIHIPVVMIAHESFIKIEKSLRLMNNEIKKQSDAVGEEEDIKKKNIRLKKHQSNHYEGSVLLVSASLESLRGKGSCQCAVESPDVMESFHFFHREGLKERLDYIVDEGKRALMSFSPVRTLKTLQHYAPQIPAYSSIGVSQVLLDDFVQNVLPLFPGPIVLVTTDYNSDRSAPQPFDIDHSWLLEAPHLVHHWFSDNWARNATLKEEQRNGVLSSSLSSHPRLTLFPIGINDRHVPKSHGDRRALLHAVESVSDNSNRPIRAMANFHHSLKLGWWNKPVSGVCCDRLEAWEALNGSINNSSSTCSVDNDSTASSTQNENLIDFVDFLKPLESWLLHSNYAFEICPQGNGIDTHRTWEALLLKTIPIVRTSSLDPLYKGLPVVIVNNWKEITGSQGRLNLKKWHSQLAPLFEHKLEEELRDKLTVEYWSKLIQQKTKNKLLN
mmetsp:Transcript_4655/g.5988  ORF Transcript_4655/g.5988 Transcript_4655/m.5988 type:complete len:618 (-) Transcript_4655:63-1916(-)